MGSSITVIHSVNRSVHRVLPTENTVGGDRDPVKTSRLVELPERFPFQLRAGSGTSFLKLFSDRLVASGGGPLCRTVGSSAHRTYREGGEEESHRYISAFVGKDVCSENAEKEAADTMRKASVHAVLCLFVSFFIGAFVASLVATFGGQQREL